jgi:hypothetical protein
VLEKDGKDQLDRSCEKLSTTKSQGEEEYPTNNKRRKDRSDGKTRKKMYAATG